MNTLAIIVVAAVALYWFFHRRKPIEPERPSRPGVPLRDDGTVPDNPRFKTWEEALNRPITGEERFLIEYADADGVITEREIRPRMIHLKPNRSEVEIEAWCALRQDYRNFRSDRVLAARNLRTNRPIADLGSYLRSRY